MGEASIIIAVSSPHRKESLDAVHFAIDHVKATVPVWKKVGAGFFFILGMVTTGHYVGHQSKNVSDFPK